MAAWPAPSLRSAPSASNTDMKFYELTEHLRSMQIVQAEQSRRLDEQASRLHQLEMKDLQSNRFDSQRYLWGAVGTSASLGAASGRNVLGGLGFDVFSPVRGEVKEKASSEMLHLAMETHTPAAPGNEAIDSIEADIDNLLLSPTATTSDIPVPLHDNPSPSLGHEPPHHPHNTPRAETESPQPPSTTPTTSTAPTTATTAATTAPNHFPYVLAIHCWLGGGRQATTAADILTAQINTSVHASFIDSSLLPHLGVTHRVRNRRSPRYNNTSNGTSSNRFTANSPRPRILLPVYFPTDPGANPACAAESQVAKIQVDFVVVTTHSPSDIFTPVEIGSQALFLHGIDVLFSSRALRVAGLNIALPQVAPRDQKRLLSSIALGMFIPSQVSASTQGWDRPRRSTVAMPQKEEEKPVNEGSWTEDSVLGGDLLRDTSTNSSFSSSTFNLPSAAGGSTAMTSPTLTDVDHCKEPTSALPETNGLPTPPLSGVFSSAALQFIPSSVVVGPRPPPPPPPPPPLDRNEESRSRASTIQLDRSQSQIEHPPSQENGPMDEPSPADGEDASSLADTLSRTSSVANDTPGTGEPRLPSTFADNNGGFSVQRKSSSTWPRSLGKRVAPWTSQSATKASILGTTFGDPAPTAAEVVVPPRRMRVLKPPGRRAEADVGGGSPEVGRDVRAEVREGSVGATGEEGRGGVGGAGKNVGGGAFHWMK